MRKVEILYFQGCPNHPLAVELARAAVAELGLETQIDISEVEVDDIEEAQSTRFLGSPSIRVDGRDIEPGAETRSEFGLSCRTYNGDGLPKMAWLTAALLGENVGGGNFGPTYGSAESSPASTRGPSRTDRVGLFSVGGALFAAVGASACCTVPLAMLGLGLSTAGISTFFEPLRPYFLGATAIALSFAFYYAFVRKPECAEGEACATPNPTLRRASKIGVIAAIPLVAAFAMFPIYAGRLLDTGTYDEIRATTPSDSQLIVSIDGMTCDACALSAERALLALPGVAKAGVSYENAAATIVLDSGNPASDQSIIDAIESIGYRATLAPNGVSEF